MSTSSKTVTPLSPSQDTYTLFCHDLPTRPLSDAGLILVTGASGYIGGRLVPELLARGYRVRVMVRDYPSAYLGRWPEAEIVRGEALDKASLGRALSGVDTAYYLIHSLLLGPEEFESADILAAKNFREAAAEQGVKRIIYLGGLGDCAVSRSRHLQCRAAVGAELTHGAVPATILRAAIIIGSGSASYEIIRHLVSRLPFLFIPRWARNRCQPIGIRDVIKYLVGVLETPATSGRSFDIGGRDILTYEEMLRTFSEIINKRTVFLSSPFSNIRVFAYLASLLTPVPAAITMSLMEGLQDEAVSRNREIQDLVPFEPLTYREAIVRALTREEQDRVYTRWSDAYPPAHELALKLHELKNVPAYTASYSLVTSKDPGALFKSVCTVGGRNGWFTNNWMWRARGGLDRVLFGVGSSRGRRSLSTLEVNDVIDFWRVEELARNRRLLLRSEMKLPGRAWLEFTIDRENGDSRLSVTAYYHTRSLFGRAYWYMFLPFHNRIFRDLIVRIEQKS